MSLKEVIDRGYAKEIYEYAKSHAYADVELLTQALLKSRKLPDRYAVSFGTDYDDDADEYPINEDDALAHYYYVFARDIKGANIDLLCNAVANAQDPDSIYNFAVSIPGANIQLLAESLDSFYDENIYLFARDVYGANIQLLEKKMKKAYPKFIYLFARDIEGANIQFLQDSLIDWAEEGYDDGVKFFEYTCKFASDIEGANIGKMISDIKSYINNYYQSNKTYPSEYYIGKLQALAGELENIKNQIKTDTTAKILNKTRNDLSQR